MQQRPVAWKYLAGMFAAFWLVFAIFLFNANIPFVIVTVALTTVLAMSAVIVGLAWAYQKGI